MSVRTPTGAFDFAARLVALDERTRTPEIDRWHELVGRWRGLGRTFYQLCERDPAYVTDTGLRRSPEPAAFFLHNARALLGHDRQAMSCDYLPDPVAVAVCESYGHEHPDADVSIDPSDVTQNPLILGQVLTCYVNSFGSWQFGLAVATAVDVSLDVDSVGDRDVALLAELAANVFAVHSDARCLRLYGAALSGAADAVERSFLQQRMATATYKRLHDDRSAHRHLSLARAEAELIGNDSDRGVVRALADNFEALMQLRSGNVARAHELARSASSTIGSIDPYAASLRSDVVLRYVLQVEQNRATMLAYDGDLDGAIAISERNVSLATTSHPESAGECLAILGYLLLRGGRAPEALRNLGAAESDIETRTSPIRWHRIIRLVALASHEAGEPAAVTSRWLGVAKQLETELNLDSSASSTISKETLA